jgi:hypothetical protein
MPLCRTSQHLLNVEVKVTLRLTVSQSVSMSWYRAPLWDLQPDIISCRNVAVLYLWDTLSDERMGLQFAVKKWYHSNGYILYVWLRV